MNHVASFPNVNPISLSGVIEAALQSSSSRHSLIIFWFSLFITDILMARHITKDHFIITSALERCELEAVHGNTYLEKPIPSRNLF